MGWFESIMEYTPQLTDIATTFVETPGEKREQERAIAEYQTQQQLASSQVRQQELQTQQTTMMVVGLGGVAILGLLIFTAT